MTRRRFPGSSDVPNLPVSDLAIAEQEKLIAEVRAQVLPLSEIPATQWPPLGTDGYIETARYTASGNPTTCGIWYKVLGDNAIEFSVSKELSAPTTPRRMTRKEFVKAVLWDLNDRLMDVKAQARQLVMEKYRRDHKRDEVLARK